MVDLFRNGFSEQPAETSMEAGEGVVGIRSRQEKHPAPFQDAAKLPECILRVRKMLDDFGRDEEIETTLFEGKDFAVPHQKGHPVNVAEFFLARPETDEEGVDVKAREDEAVFLSDRVLVFARRPGRLLESVAIELSRPRPLAIKRTAEFVRYVDHIWRLIEDDVRASVIEEKV